MAQELKRRHINEVMDMHNLTKGKMGYSIVYYAEEVDAVLAEKDAENAKLKADNERLMKIVLCQKYKIALMKAKWCEERCCRYSLQQEIQDVSWEKEIKFYRRLCAKYLELAEKFKE